MRPVGLLSNAALSSAQAKISCRAARVSSGTRVEVMARHVFRSLSEKNM
jgi:hypothetical protein